jgi:hypothetical protein
MPVLQVELTVLAVPVSLGHFEPATFYLPRSRVSVSKTIPPGMFFRTPEVCLWIQMLDWQYSALAFC